MTPVATEGDVGGLALLRPRREVREVEARCRLPGNRIGVHLERERGQLGAVHLLDVVRALVLRSLPPDDVRFVAPVRPGGPDAVGIVEGRSEERRVGKEWGGGRWRWR